jgi:hypothetical protein
MFGKGEDEMKKKKYNKIKMEIMHYETKDEVMRDGISLGGISTATLLLGASAGDNAIKALNENVDMGNFTMKLYKGYGLDRLH